MAIYCGGVFHFFDSPLWDKRGVPLVFAFSFETRNDRSRFDNYRVPLSDFFFQNSFFLKGSRVFFFHCAAASDDFDLAPRFVFRASRVVARSARSWCLLFHVIPVTHGEKFWFFCLSCLFLSSPFTPSPWYSTYTYRHDRPTSQVRIFHKMKGNNRFRRRWNVNDSNAIVLNELKEQGSTPKISKILENYFGLQQDKRERETDFAVVCCLVCFCFVFLFFWWVFIISEVSVDSV